MARRFQSLLQYVCTETAPDSMGSFLINNDPQILAEVAAAHVPALSDDVYHLIRTVVPPPPLLSAGTHVINENYNRTSETQTENLASNLFTRRPTEESLILKVDRQTSCAKEAKTNLEELYIQLIEPKKYTNEAVIQQLIFKIKEQWPADQNIQQQALKCLLHLNQHSSNFLLSHATALSVLNSMKLFQNNEMVQRMGMKLLVSCNSGGCLRNKVDLAYVVFNSLCSICGVDDFMLYAKNLVSELDYNERTLLRSHERFVDMMLDFPHRKNDQVTVYLSWCALDTLILLAECNQRWDTLIGCDGKAKLQRLSLRPELEDRCAMLLDRVFSASCEKISALNLVTVSQSQWSPVRVVAHPTEYPKVGCGFSQASRSRDVMAVDEFITRTLPTPPPTVAGFEVINNGRFSDDEMFTPSSPFLPYRSPSPSYSPPPETNAILLKEIGELPSPFPITENGASVSCSREKIITSDTTALTANNRPSQHAPRSKPKSKLSLNRTPIPAAPCIFCKEPKGRQTLLVKQLKQIAHCLQQPCNLLLFKCLEANLCDDHRI
ncbi:hypothetical protein ONE63_009789 [Megalurothrips usitatus]|uniref:Uncharacterized protein n=1 Tax=Megalurothrips usitatus TaxID=439358 RepID=A0AAV7XJV7_9NEOP|nr:hypothetical protein ONE63_009789 [Megalurothrips usitatus]